jgi:hypothetical protein
VLTFSVVEVALGWRGAAPGVALGMRGAASRSKAAALCNIFATWSAHRRWSGRELCRTVTVAATDSGYRLSAPQATAKQPEYQAVWCDNYKQYE